MPQDASLDSLFVELYSQPGDRPVRQQDEAAVRDRRTSGAIGPVEKVTYAHEYTHALQDQNYDLDGRPG